MLGELGFRLASGQAKEGSDVEAPGSVVRAPERLCRLCGFPSEGQGRRLKTALIAEPPVPIPSASTLPAGGRWLVTR